MSMELSNQKKLSEFCEEIKRLKINIIRPDINTCFTDFSSKNNELLLCIRSYKKCRL